MEKVTVEIEVNAELSKVWQCWTLPEYITQWNFASDEWCCPKAVNPLKEGSEFLWRMESKDGQMGFDFTGTYTSIKNQDSISYQMSDGRVVDIQFEKTANGVKVTETFDTEDVHSAEMQRAGWQAILGNFKKCVESSQ